MCHVLIYSAEGGGSAYVSAHLCFYCGLFDATMACSEVGRQQAAR